MPVPQTAFPVEELVALADLREVFEACLHERYSENCVERMYVSDPSLDADFSPLSHSSTKAVSIIIFRFLKTAGPCRVR